MREKTSVIVVDEDAIFRAGVIHILGSSSDLDIVGEGSSKADAIDLAIRLRPQIALIDISIPGGGIKAAQGMHYNCPEVRVLMLTVSEEEDIILQALDAGASGYALKGGRGADLIKIIRSIAQGGSYVAPQMTGRLLTAMRSRLESNPMAARIAALTVKERQTLQFLARGFRNRDVAEATGVSVQTVKFHVSNVLSKLGAKNRVEAAHIGRSHRTCEEA